MRDSMFLGDFAKFKKGKGLSKNDLSCLGTPCVHYGQLFTEYGAQISKVISLSNTTPEKPVFSNAGDVLMPTSDVTPTGLATASMIPFEGVVLGSDILIISADKKVCDPLYLSYFINNSKSQILGLASGTTVFHIYEKDMRLLRVNLPPLEKQREIAATLSTWDRAIELHDKLIALKEKQKQGLMQVLLTGKKRLLDDNGVPFSGDWEETTLGKAAAVEMGSSPKSENYNDNGNGLPLIQGNADICSRLSSPRTFTSEITKECLPGDILLSVRAPVGTVALSTHHACIGRGISSIRAGVEAVQQFLYQMLLLQEPKWASISQGSTFESVNSKEIKSLRIFLPTVREQIKISGLLSIADSEISAAKRKRDLLKLQKQGLMQQLLG